MNKFMKRARNHKFFMTQFATNTRINIFFTYKQIISKVVNKEYLRQILSQKSFIVFFGLLLEYYLVKPLFRDFH